MEDAYRWQAYYRSVGQRETEMSYLRDMFTEGYPIRSKFDEQLKTWLSYYERRQEMELASETRPAAAPEEQRGVLVPRY